jgi:hypothetical protein
MGWDGLGSSRSAKNIDKKMSRISLHLFRVILLLLLHCYFEYLQLGLSLAYLGVVVGELVDHLAHAIRTSPFQHPRKEEKEGRRMRRGGGGEEEQGREDEDESELKGEERQREGRSIMATYLHSSGSRPSGKVEEVGLPITAVEAALEECECPAGAAAFLTGSLDAIPFTGGGAALEAAGPATFSLLS